jgi:predicted TIM-barrel fold metal-dependent hydrolase
VFAEAVANRDARMERVYFDVSGVAGLGRWAEKATIVAARLRQLGLERVLYGSDGATAGGLTPSEAWEAFRQLPLSDDEFRVVAGNVAPYME